MIEHALPWTTNLDQLAWAASEFAVLLVALGWWFKWTR
jgi:hypothetical protein